MPRKRTILQSEFPYHIYARCINRQWFDLPTRMVWEIMSDYLDLLHHFYGFRIHSFVLMDNHFHGLVTTPNANLSQGMNYFMREVSRRITEYSGRINQTFGGPYQWCLVNSYNYYLNAYKYVYRNPVEAGLSPSCDTYEFSSLFGVLGKAHITFPVNEDTILFDPNFRWDAIEWLNRGNPEDFEIVGRALKKGVFQYCKDNSTGMFLRDDNWIF